MLIYKTNVTTNRSETLLEKKVQRVVAPMVQEEMLNEEIPYRTPEELQAKTNEIYASLTPENHEETMQEAAVAFEKLDVYVAEIDEKLAQEMQALEALNITQENEVQPIEEIEINEEEIVQEEVITPIE